MSKNALRILIPVIAIVVVIAILMWPKPTPTAAPTYATSVAPANSTSAAPTNARSVAPTNKTGAGASPLSGAKVVTLPSVCTGYTYFNAVPMVPPIAPNKTYVATIVTSLGTMTAKLDAVNAPVTVASFVYLANHHYFDTVSFHRIMKGFMVQGGDPTGTGECGPGYAFNNENTAGGYTTGTLAMANSGANTNGSQFFIMLADNPSLPASYSVFGHLVGGTDVLQNLGSVPVKTSLTGELSAPVTRVFMKSVRVSIS